MDRQELEQGAAKESRRARGDRVRRIFDASVELPRAARAAFLDRMCAGDVELRRRVEAVLAVDDEAEGFLEGATWAPPVEEVPRPERLGPYLVGEPIGRGGMGVVYRAEGPGGTVAVKTVSLPEPGMLAGIRREIVALSRLGHPGVVRILDHGVEGGVPWYAMEAIDGTTLRDAILVRERRDALTLFRRLCGILAYVHGEGVVHRDLKPDNVRVRSGGWPVLLDFGLTIDASGRASRDSLLHGGDVAGTADYMAPEQADGRSVDARSDLYSLGCMLRELVPGATAAGSSSDGLAALVQRLLATDPAERPGHASEVGAELVRLGAETADPWSEPPPARSYVYRPALRGREEILDDLRRIAASVEAGRGTVVLLGGDSGSGKTRLLLEAASRLGEQGWEVLAGECAGPSDVAPSPAPLQPFRRVLRQLGERCRGRGPGEVERVLGRRAALLARYEPSLGGAAAELPPAAERRRTLRALTETLAAAATRPLLVVLDDLQWADDASIEAIRQIDRSRALRARALLLIATHRAGEAGERLDRLRSEGTARIDLAPLGAEAISSLVADMLAIPRPPRSFVRQLMTASEGSPFYVAEYLRAAVDDGRIARSPTGSWLLPDARSVAGALPMPASIREVARARIAPLAGAAHELVCALAVLGRQASVELLSEVARLDEEGRLDATTLLISRHIVEETGPGVLRFTHDTLREVAHAGMGDGERRELHRAAAQAVERRGIERPEQEAALGRHLRAAGDLENARPRLLGAARRMVAGHLVDEARSLYEEYLALVDAPTEESVAARHELGRQVLLRRGLAREAERQLERALAEARQLRLAMPEARLLVSLILARHNAGALDEGLATCEAARAALLDLGDRRLLADVAIAEGAILHELGRADASREATHESLRIALETGHERCAAHARANLAAIAQLRGDDDEARRLYAEALIGGTDESRALVLGNLASLALVHGEFREAERLSTRAVHAARELARPDLEAGALAKLASVHNARGDHATEIALWEQSAGILREIDGSAHLAHTLGGFADTLLDLGRLDEAEVILQEAGLHARAAKAALPEAFVDAGLGRLAALRGEIDEALDRCLRARDALRLLGSHAGAGRASATLASLARRCGDLDAAWRHAREGLAAFEQVRDAMGEGECLRELAETESCAGGDWRPALARADAVVAHLGLAPGNSLAASIAALRRLLDVASTAVPGTGAP